MYTPPFHRRIIPWIFAAVFLASAPILVFYTAGYRWNPKKEKVERNGTLIVDSEPTGASIFMNGSNTNEQTPITIQNIRPGRYTIVIQKEGYLAWEKELDVQSSFVTFASDIWLWRDVGLDVFNRSTSTFASFDTPQPLLAPPVSFSIVNTTGTKETHLIDSQNPDRIFLLPDGDWEIMTRQGNRLILQDKDRWLSVNLQSDNPVFQRATGDELRPFTLRGQTAYLLLHGGEVWIWNPTKEPQLLLRQSEPLVQVAWHKSGSYILLATKTEISALHLDPRNGRLRTTLASLEDIEGMIVRDEDLLVMGKRDGQEAIWRRILE